MPDAGTGRQNNSSGFSQDPSCFGSLVPSDDEYPLPGQHSTPSPSLQHDDLSKLTQETLRNASKRRKLSCSGVKSILATRLVGAGFKTLAAVRALDAEYKTLGVDDSALSRVRQKAPRWTKHETARLYHVMNHPSYSDALIRLYNKPESRAALETRHDPWVNEFSTLFNDPLFLPSIPQAHDGVTDDILSDFDPTLHPVKREGAVLKSRWNKLRSRYCDNKRRFSNMHSHWSPKNPPSCI